MRLFTKTSSIRKDTIWGAVAVFALILLTCFFWTLIPAVPLATRAQTLKPGDSKEKVREVLGKPTSVFLTSPQAKTNWIYLILGVQKETWAYGHRFDSQAKFPYFSLRIRLFGPDTDDVSVTFDSSGRVLGVKVPKTMAAN
jgi:outer membrane protein assembly factor BamE (lipoprotein component of BamABCDE complex)